MGNQNAYVETFAIGRAELVSLTLVLDPLFEQLEEDGVLGSNAVESLLMTLDYPAMTVQPTLGELGPANGEDILAYDPAPSGPTLRVRIGDRVVDALLDTGAVRWLIMPPSEADTFEFAAGPVAGGLAVGPNWAEPNPKSPGWRMTCVWALSRWSSRWRT